MGCLSLALNGLVGDCITLGITCPQRAGVSGNSLGLGALEGVGQVHVLVSSQSINFSK